MFENTLTVTGEADADQGSSLVLGLGLGLGLGFVRIRVRIRVTGLRSCFARPVPKSPPTSVATVPPDSAPP